MAIMAWRKFLFKIQSVQSCTGRIPSAVLDLVSGMFTMHKRIHAWMLACICACMCVSCDALGNLEG